VEVDTDPGEGPGLAWELLRDPGTGAAVALQAGSFVRTDLRAAGHPDLPEPAGDRLRVLLVIARPEGRVDVPFRSAGLVVRDAHHGQQRGTTVLVQDPGLRGGGVLGGAAMPRAMRANTASASNRGKHSQSTEPDRLTSVADRQAGDRDPLPR
jgi:hypothetical protein